MEYPVSLLSSIYLEKLDSRQLLDGGSSSHDDIVVGLFDDQDLTYWLDLASCGLSTAVSYIIKPYLDGLNISGEEPIQYWKASLAQAAGAYACFASDSKLLQQSAKFLPVAFGLGVAYNQATFTEKDRPTLSDSNELRFALSTSFSICAPWPLNLLFTLDSLFILNRGVSSFVYKHLGSVTDADVIDRASKLADGLGAALAFSHDIVDSSIRVAHKGINKTLSTLAPCYHAISPYYTQTLANRGCLSTEQYQACATESTSWSAIGRGTVCLGKSFSGSAWSGLVSAKDSVVSFFV